MFQKLLRHRFLFEELVKRDFKKKYKRTILGMAWSLLSKNVQTFINFLLTLVIFFVFVAFDHLAYPICCLILFNIGVGIVLLAW